MRKLRRLTQPCTLSCTGPQCSRRATAPTLLSLLQFSQKRYFTSRRKRSETPGRGKRNLERDPLFPPPPANGGRQQLGPVVRGALLMRRTARPNCRMLALSLATPNNFLTVFTPPPCAITALCASDIRKRLGDFWGVPSEGPAFMPHEV